MSATVTDAAALPRAKGEPEWAFSHLRVVRKDEEDEQEHTSNVSYVQWVQDIAHQHTDTLGYTIERYRAIGGAFVVQRHDIEYSAPTFAGDTLRVVTWVEDWRPMWTTRHTVILRVDSGAVAARAATTWVWLDVARARPGRIPQEVRDAFSAPMDKSLCDKPYLGREAHRPPA